MKITNPQQSVPSLVPTIAPPPPVTSNPISPSVGGADRISQAILPKAPGAVAPPASGVLGPEPNGESAPGGWVAASAMSGLGAIGQASGTTASANTETMKAKGAGGGGGGQVSADTTCPVCGNSPCTCNDVTAQDASEDGSTADSKGNDQKTSGGVDVAQVSDDTPCAVCGNSPCTCNDAAPLDPSPSSIKGPAGSRANPVAELNLQATIDAQPSPFAVQGANGSSGGQGPLRN